MVRIRRFGVMRTATVAAVMYAVVIFVFFAILALFALAIPSSGLGAPGFSAGAGFAAVLITGLVGGVIYAIIGWIVTAIGCVFYNFVAGIVGGIEIQLEQVVASPMPTWGPPPSAAPPTTAPPSATSPSPPPPTAIPPGDAGPAA